MPHSPGPDEAATPEPKKERKSEPQTIEIFGPEAPLRPGVVGAKVRNVTKQLSGPQMAGVFLAVLVGVLIAFVTTWLIRDSLGRIPAVTTLDINMPDAELKAAIANYNALQDAASTRVVQVFEKVVITAFLPVFTSILGYIFGSKVVVDKDSG